MNKYLIIISLFAVHCSLFTSFRSYGQESDSLNHYLKQAAENNPSVRAAFHIYEAALQKVPQMGAYEDPQLEMGFFLEPMNLVDGRQIAQFQLMQMFPWFGTKKAAQTEAQHMARMAFEAFRETRNNLYLEVYTQWYILSGLQQKLINNEANKQLLQQLEQLAIAKYSSGTSTAGRAEYGERGAAKGGSEQANRTTGMAGMNMETSSLPTPTQPASGAMSGMNMGTPASGMSDALRIQLEILELESNAESLLSEITAAKARFNALLNRPAESKLAVPDVFSQLPFLLDMPTSTEKIAEQNPMLGMIREETSAYKARSVMDKKMGYPMFGIGLQYMLIGKTPPTAAVDATPPAMSMAGSSTSNGTGSPAAGTMQSMNGKDMWMPMLSVSIPLYRNKYKAAQRESKLLRQASEEKYSDTFNRLQAELYQSKHQLEDAQRKIALYKKQAALAHTTYNLMVQEFISGKGSLSDIISVQRQLLDYRLRETEAIATYNTIVANIQKLTAQ